MAAERYWGLVTVFWRRVWFEVYKGVQQSSQPLQSEVLDFSALYAPAWQQHNVSRLKHSLYQTPLSIHFPLPSPISQYPPNLRPLPRNNRNVHIHPPHPLLRNRNNNRLIPLAPLRKRQNCPLDKGDEGSGRHGVGYVGIWVIGSL